MFSPILITLLFVAVMIGCTILVWKFGLDGDRTWPSDLGILLQCVILVVIGLVHFVAWNNIVMLNTYILVTCSIFGFILQFIEERFCEGHVCIHFAFLSMCFYCLY